MSKPVRIISEDYDLGKLGDTVTISNDEYLQALYVAGAVEDADGPNSLEAVYTEDGRNLADLNVEDTLAALQDGSVTRELVLESENKREKPRASVVKALEAE